MDYKLGMIGYGNMATGMADAILTTGTLTAEEIAVCDVSPRARQRATERGLAVTDTVRQLCASCELVLLAVKPNTASGVLGEAGTSLENKALMSIVAGVPSGKLKEFSRNHFMRVLRIMPNTPAMVGEGMMTLCSDTDFTAEEREKAEKLMGAVGVVEWIEESHMDTVTGLSGSGPAYVAMFIEALADGGVREGLSRPQAMNLAMQTVLGTAKLLRDKEMHPGELKDMVCSPGGTAITGVEALEKNGFRHAVMQAVVAATEKSKRMI